ncbi:MAG TPA: YceI family protein [Ferruginibacter sp.]|nr:YceI family protein [Ferruginibacter sp.]
MINRLGILLILALIIQSGVPHSVVYNTSKGVINFRSDAPLEMIKASSNELHGKLDAEKRIFAFTVRISSFEGFNSPLQKEHFNENYLESNRYPDAHFSGKIIEDIDLSKDATYIVRAKGILFLHGISQERIIKSEFTVKNGTISIKSNFTVLLNEHNIPIPKVVNEKLASEIKVEVKADLIPQ